MEYRGKVFRSGNSVALRLPKELGIGAGTQMRLLRETPTSFRFEPIDAPKRKFDIDKVWGVGRHLGLKPIAPEDRLFGERLLARDGSASSDDEPAVDR